MSAYPGRANKFTRGSDDSHHEDQTDSEDEIDIHEIVRTGTLAEVRENLAKDRPRFIALKDEHGRTILHYAALLDRVKIALHLIAKNANVNAKDNQSLTPLHLAAANGLTDMCRFLLDFHANIRLKDTNCWTALHHAVDKDHYDTATLLIKRNAEMNVEDHQFGRTPLHLAAEHGYTKMCEMLIIRGADLYASGDAFYSKTPLHIACLHNHLETTQLLIKRGSHVDALSGLVDKTPLHMVCELGYVSAAAILLQAGAQINLQGNTVNGSSALHLACEHNHLGIVDLLIQHRADIELAGKFTTYGTSLHVACMKGHAHIVHFLLDSGAKLESTDSQQHTPLHLACMHGHYDLAIALIEQRANFHAKALNNKTPIDYIKVPTMKDRILIICKKMDKIRELEELHRVKQIEAEKERQKEMARILVEQQEREAKARQLRQQRTLHFQTSLFQITTQSGEASALLALLQSCTDENLNSVLEEEKGCNALLLAAKSGFYELVKVLVCIPTCQLDFQDYDLNTALHHAAQQNARDMVEELLLAGASHTRLNRQGFVAANCTTNNNIREILRNPKLIHGRAVYREAILKQFFPDGMPTNSTSRRWEGKGEEEPGEEEVVESWALAMSVPGTSTLSGGSFAEETSGIQEPRGPDERRLPSLQGPSAPSSPSKKSTANPPATALTTSSQWSALTGYDEDIEEGFTTPRRVSSQLALPAIPLSARKPSRNATGKNGHSQPFSSGQSAVAKAGATSSVPSLPALVQPSSLSFDPYHNYPHGFLSDATDFFALKECISKRLQDIKQNEVNHELHLLQHQQLKQIANKYKLPTTHASSSSTTAASSCSEALSSPHAGAKQVPWQPSLLVNSVNIQKSIFMLQYSYLPDSFDHSQEYLQKKNLLLFFGLPFAFSRSRPFFPSNEKRIAFFEKNGGGLGNHRSKQSAFALTTGSTNGQTEEEREREREDEEEEGGGGGDEKQVRVGDWKEYAGEEEEEASEQRKGKEPWDVRENVFHVGALMDSMQRHVFSQERLPADFGDVIRSYHLQYDRFLDEIRRQSNPLLIGDGEQDCQRVCALAALCLGFVEYFLRCYDNVYIQGLHDSFAGDVDPETVVAKYTEQVQYLAAQQYVDHSTFLLLTKLLTLCHVRNLAASTVAEQEQEKEEEEEEEEEEDFVPRDPLRRLWSEVVLNPPRALRLAVDHFYELGIKLLAFMEKVYPQDAVRANVWYYKYCDEKKDRTQEQLRRRYATLQAAQTQFDLAAEMSGSPSTGEAKAAASFSPKMRSLSAPPGETTGPASAVTALSLWLYDGHLVEYEECFVQLGFKVLEDFQGLSDEDCFQCFPFLKVGDRRRLCKQCNLLSTHRIQVYTQRAAVVGTAAACGVGEERREAAVV